MTGGYWPELSDETIAEIVSSSLKGGINWFDTAEAYGGGASEQSLARALGTLQVNPNPPIIADKWWPLMRTSRSLVDSIDERLNNLNVSRIDLYQIHLPYSLSSIKDEMCAMAHLVKGGKIRFIGLSNYSAALSRKAHNELKEQGLYLVSNQAEFNLLNRRIETNGKLETAKDLGISIIAYSPLAQGLLTGKFHENPNRLRELQPFRRIYKRPSRRTLERTQPVIDVLNSIADKYHASAAQVALNWMINVHGETIVAIAGASKPEHAIDNASAMLLNLSEGDMQRLDRVSLVFAGRN